MCLPAPYHGRHPTQFPAPCLARPQVAARAAAASPAAHRKVRFVHVKINRAHCRATYEGYPL